MKYFNKMKSEIPNYEEADGKGSMEFGMWTKDKIAKGKLCRF